LFHAALHEAIIGSPQGSGPTGFGVGIERGDAVLR
jgi:hypothetical protein